MLKIKAVSKKYNGKDVLKNISINFKPGIYGLLGENGAGKTTLINILVGLIMLSDGMVLFNDNQIEKLGNKYFEHIGYSPQYPQFYKNFTGLEFMKYMCKLKGEKNTVENTQLLLEKMNLCEHMNKKIGKYSGGMKQRLSIAQALIGNPKIIILDEPTAGLDPMERIRFRKFIASLAKDKIIIITTHIIQDVEYIANHILILKNGEIIGTGEPKVLCKMLAGKVFEICATEEELVTYENNFIVSNISHNGNNYNVRYIDINSHNGSVEPSLEELFLYLQSQHNIHINEENDDFDL